MDNGNYDSWPEGCRILAWVRLIFARGTEISLGALAVFFFLVATNTQTGWLYLLTALLGGTLLYGFLRPRGVVDRVEVSLQLEPRGQVGQPTQLKVRMRNSGPGRALGVLLEWLPPDWCVCDHERRGLYQSRLEPGEEVVFELTLLPGRRGDRRLQELSLSCAYPFGFFPRRRGLPDSPTILVLPRIDRTELRERLARLPGLGSSGVQPNKKGQTQEFRCLRDYRQGEDLRHVQWPTSSRLGSLMLKEYAAPARLGTRLVLDNRPPETEWDAFESMVEQVAGWLYWSHRRGVQAGLYYLDDDGWVELGSQESAALESLARLPFGPRLSDRDWMQRVGEIATGGLLVGWRHFETQGYELWVPTEVPG